MKSTRCAEHSAISAALIGRDAPATGIPPAHSFLNPSTVPDPLAEICTPGCCLLKADAIAVVTGMTVLEPSMGMLPDSVPGANRPLAASSVSGEDRQPATARPASTT